ncbi:solute carrier family 35 member G1-like protein [Dinothrombium tinctorium]|uniref:Solute carrier family 35 member G1-like protein n=1 Tax=Dinothrombium tinctorium TaxID=1965070 RepID=A0A443QHW9_9ACAR|nr:solute carrier family 35 member G1-like protein [Dinothrombium tinctorium]
MEPENNWLYSKLSKIPAAGIFFALSAGIFFAFGQVLVKILKDINPIELFAVRSALQAVNFIAIILWNKQTFLVPREEIKFLIPRCITGFFAVARVFLSEPFGLFQIFTILASISGTILISRPTFLFPSDDSSSISVSHRINGALISILSAFTTALSFILVKKQPKTPASVITFWYSVFVVVVGIIYIGISKDFVVPKDSKSYILLFLVGFCGTFGQLFLAMSLKLEEASVVAVAYTIDIVFAYIFQVSLINEKLTLLSLIGALIICLSIVASAVRKLIVEKPLLRKKVSKSKINSYEVQTQDSTLFHVELIGVYNVRDQN